MIVWLASYPKSGNTLVRSMLAAYFFSKDGIYNFELIKNIKQFPNINLFENLGVDIESEEDVIKNYINAQKSFNRKNTIQFLKTHSYLFNFKNKYPFTDLNNSLGVIYIIRDPRNVVTSFANFMSISAEEASEFMINSQLIKGNLTADKTKGDRTTVLTGTWSSNFKSWKSFKSQEKYLLIKYEDLITNPENIFLKILKFIHALNKSKLLINKEKLNNLLKTTSFEYMKNLENEKGFEETKLDKKTGKKIPFFNLGKKNNWKDILDTKIQTKLEKAFSKEMKELGYL